MTIVSEMQSIINISILFYLYAVDYIVMDQIKVSLYLNYFI
jgi:hypothetical protein